MATHVRHDLKGIYTPVVTPFDADGKVNLSLLRRLIEAQIAAGVDGFYLCGGTGEGLLLTVAERKAMLEAALDQIKGRVGIIDHIGAFQTADTVELARHAGVAGADAISCLPPSWFYKPDADGLLGYYGRVADAGGLPLLIYNIPQRTGVELTPALMEKLRRIKNLVGFKHSTPDIYQMRQIIHMAHGELIVFIGFEELLLPALTYGAAGSIGGMMNLAPRIYVEIYRHFVAGEYARAAELQLREIELASVIDEFETIAAVKETVRLLGFDCGLPRTPTRPMTDEEKARLRRRLDDVHFFTDPLVGLGA